MDFYDLKGVVELLLGRLGVKPEAVNWRVRPDLAAQSSAQPKARIEDIVECPGAA
jgi:hypothetical protein